MNPASPDDWQAPIPPADLAERFERAGQAHIFRFWSELDGAARGRLAAQAARIDPLVLAQRLASALSLAAATPTQLTPAPVVGLDDTAIRTEACDAGEALLARGGAAVLVMAGGQGTRLGWPGPKGAFPLGPVTGRSLFGLQAQKLRGLARRYGCPVPWYVMTSESTHAACRALFEAEGYFGLPPEDVVLFRQASLPVLDPDGRLMLEARDRIAESPDGHGGAIPALARSGGLAELEARGIERIATYQVDNALVQIADPTLLGLHDVVGAEMSCKVIAKGGPGERAGSIGLVGGQLRVVEYTEIDPVQRALRGADGRLVHWAASIGIHGLDLALVRRVASRAEERLPFHASLKRIPILDKAGNTLESEGDNGYKLERFVFDALVEAQGGALLEVRREDEYSPIKNPSGEHSPETARRDLDACTRRWLRAAGIRGLPESGLIELDHALIDGPADAIGCGIQDAAEAAETIRMGME